MKTLYLLALTATFALLSLPRPSLAGLSSPTDNERVAAMLRWYAGSEVNEIIVSKANAERLARAALKVDPSGAEATFQRLALELSHLSYFGLNLLSIAGKPQLTAEEKKKAEDGLTLHFVKFGQADANLLVKVLDAMALK